LFRRLFDDSGKVATTTVFHENVENSSVSINITVVISYNVVVMKVLQYVPSHQVSWANPARMIARVHFGYNLFPVPLTHPLKVEFFPGEDLRMDNEHESLVSQWQSGTHQSVCFPSDFANDTK